MYGVFFNPSSYSMIKLLQITSLLLLWRTSVLLLWIIHTWPISYFHSDHSLSGVKSSPFYSTSTAT